MKEYYTRDKFPVFIMNHGNWDIYMKHNGHCAAIARVPGCISSHYGDINYVISTTKDRDVTRRVNAIHSRGGAVIGVY